MIKSDRRLLSFSAIPIFLAITFFGIGFFPWILDQFNSVHEQPMECEKLPEGSAFCREFYADDGRIREISYFDETGNCCLINRINLSQQTLSTTDRYCAPQSAEPVQCAQAWHYKDPASAVFGNIILSIDPS